MNPPLSRTANHLLLFALGAGVALHADNSPPWCLAFAAGALLWRWLHVRGRVALPAPALRGALTVILMLAWILSFRTLGGLAAGSALLILMGSAKLLETRTQRDAMVTSITVLVLVLAATLDRQSLIRLPLYLGAAWLALAAMAATGGRHAATATRHAMGTAGKAAVLAIPLATIGFLLVPRLPGALWSMPGSGQQTGLSDEMTPGSISDLTISDEIAFRVQFEGPAPEPAERYWRGPVLHDFDGATWRRTPGQMAVRQSAEPASDPLRYLVMLEPHGRHYLFVLDTIHSVSGVRNHAPGFDGQVQSVRPVTTPISYQAVSHLRVRYGEPLSIIGRRLDTALPAGRNPRSIELARRLRSLSTSDEDYARRVLEHLRTGGFRYTLSPPLVERDSVDELLFRTRLGFCGHFASAFVTLMRAAGIPARVVTGYQGGAWNRIGGYYIVRQSDAHAWAEVWFEGSGWTRIDPTAVVAPERLQRGLGDLLTGRSEGAGLLGTAGWLMDLRNAWDAAGTWWQRRVVNYNQSAQQNLLERFGLDRLGHVGMALLTAAGAGLWMLLVMAWLQARKSRPRGDVLTQRWRQFAALMASRGVAIAANDGPDAVRRRAMQQLPAAAADIEAFAAAYQQLRFGAGAQETDRLAELRLRLRRIARATAGRRRRRTAPAAQE